MMNVIRCDEQDYLIWKWKPSGQETNTTSRENGIRYGSSLRVKDGEVAVFVYKQEGGYDQDFIVGPCDQTLKTANLPVLAKIVGAAFGGESPFQAEVYFINLAKITQMRFGVPYFDIFDPRYPDFPVPVAVRGVITFRIEDYKGFIKLHRLVEFTMDQFLKQVKSAIAKYVKGVVVDAPSQYNIPAIQIERKILEVNELLQAYLQPRLESEFGIKVSSIDVSDVEIDKESEGYYALKSITKDIQSQTIQAQAEANVKNMQDTQRINAENMEDMLRRQREEAQRAQRLQTESLFMPAFAMEQQTDVLKTAASNLGQMGDMGGNGGFNPAGMMTGMAMGGAMGQQMAGMMNQMGQQMNTQAATPPPFPGAAIPVQYYIGVNGQSAGPYDWAQLQQLVMNGHLNANTLVWKQGMAAWVAAGTIQELSPLWGSVPPPMPPTHPMP